MNTNKKTAILCLSHFEGGMELDSIKNSRIFLRNGIDTILICKKDSFIEKRAIELDIPHIAIKFKTKLSLSLIFRLREAILNQNISTIIFFGASEIKSIYFAVLNLSCRVIVRHGTTKSKPKKDILHKLFYSCVEFHVAISKHLYKNVLYIFPCQDAQIRVIYNIPENIHTHNFRPEKRSFLHVGRVSIGKGAYDAVRALKAANIPMENKVLTFVGAYEQNVKNELEAIAENEVKLIFSGFVSNVDEYYHNNRYFLFPSYGEGLPNVILESLNFGLYPITYDNTVFPEFSNIFNGFFIAKDKSIDDLAKKIELCFHLDNLHSKNENTPIISDIFSERKFIEDWQKIIK